MPGVTVIQVVINIQWSFIHLKYLLNTVQVTGAFADNDTNSNKRHSSFPMEFTVWQEELKTTSWYKVSVSKGKGRQNRAFWGNVTFS